MKKLLSFIRDCAIFLWPLAIFPIYIYWTGIPIIHILTLFFSIILMTASIYCLGQEILDVLKLETITFIENISMSMSIGLALLYYIFLFMGLLGLLHWIYIYILFLLILILFRKKFLYLFLLFIRNLRKYSGNRFSVLGAVFLIILVVSMVLSLVHIAAPPADVYSLTGSLSYAQKYALKGAVYEVPFDYVSKLPPAMSILQAGSVFIYSIYSARYISYLMLLVLIVALYSMTRRYFHRKIAISAVVLMVSTPLVIKSYLSDHSILGAILFTFMAMYTFINWTSEINKERSGKSWLALSGAFTALAVHFGYFSLFVPMVFLLMIMSIKLYKKEIEPSAQSALILATYIFPFILFLTPLLIRNILLTGWPIYPFFVTEDISNTMTIEAAKTLWGYLLPLWHFPFQQEMTVKNLYMLGPAFIVFLPGLLLIKEFGWNMRLLLKFFIIYLIIYVVAGRRIAYIYPIIPIMCMLSAYVIANMYGKKRNLYKFIHVLLLLSVSLNIYYIWPWLKIDNKINYVLGYSSDSDYMDKVYPYNDMLKHINANTSKTSKVIMAGTNYSMLVKRDVFAPSTWMKSPFVIISHEQGDNPEKIYMELIHLDINYILVHPDGVAVKAGWDEKSRAALDKIITKFSELTMEREGYYLYRLL